MACSPKVRQTPDPLPVCRVTFPAQHQQVQPELPAQGDLPGGPGRDEGDGPAVPEHALLRVKTIEGLAGQAGSHGEPEAGPASDADYGIRAIYRRPRTSKPGPGHKIYPYLLGGMEITRPNLLPRKDGRPTSPTSLWPKAFCIWSFRGRMDWYSRHVVAWRLSNTLDADFGVEALEDALGKGKPEVINTDQGSQSTGEAFTGVLEQNNVRISPDESGPSAWTGNSGTPTTSCWSGCGAR